MVIFLQSTSEKRGFSKTQQNTDCQETASIMHSRSAKRDPTPYEYSNRQIARRPQSSKKDIAGDLTKEITDELRS